MKKLFNKAVLNGTTVVGDGLTYPRIPNVYTGDNEGGYQRGDMMDANAVVEMIKELTDTGEITIDELLNLINEEIQERVEGDQDQQRYTDEKIKNLIGTSPETLDTLKEIADALGEDPDFAANVWNKIAELTTKHDADIQELQDAITSGFENIDFAPYIKKTDVVTDTTNGLMLTSDKVKLDAFEDAEQYANALNLPDYTISNADISSDANNVTIKYTRDNLIGGGSSEVNLLIPAATFNAAGIMSSQDKKKVYYIPDDIITDLTYQKTSSSPYDVAIGIIKKSMSDGLHRNHKLVLLSADQSKAGVMSAYDKQKLDSLVNYQAGNGIDITGDTISCTLDTSLYSIVTELPETGLPNKIYLLPSTETEEGNIYTEYGYVDNKWEELGKYKADVDLTPYSRALRLPNVVSSIGNSHAHPGEFIIDVDNKNLDDGTINSKEIHIPEAGYMNSNNSGLMSAFDKRKLDTIDVSAINTSIAQLETNINTLLNNNPNTAINNFNEIVDFLAGIEDSETLEGVLAGISQQIAEKANNIDIPKSIKFVRDNYNPDILSLLVYNSAEDRLFTDKLYLLDRGKSVSLITKDYHGSVLIEASLNVSSSNGNLLKVDDNGYCSVIIPNATTSKEGLMSSTDKTNLDSLVGKCIDWSDDNAGLLPIYNGDGSDGEWIYTHWIGAGQGTDNTWRKASDIILENITSDAILNNTPNATTSKAGLMSVNDKHKLENPLYYYYRNSGYDTLISHTTTGESLCYNGSAVLEILGEKVEFKGVKICTYNGTPYIDCSTPTAVASLLDGLMSKEDKAKLDSQPTIKASNATGVTDDDYVVIKKSELDSILSRLTALENKA